MDENSLIDLSGDLATAAPNKSSNGLSKPAKPQENFTTSGPFSGLQITHVQSLQSVAGDIFDTELSSPISTDAGATMKRRRKSIHVPVALDDDLEFQDDAETVPFKRSDNIKSTDESRENIKMRDRLRNIRHMPNPNVDLISKASFLRVSVAFLMKELGYKPLQIVNNSSIANLKAQYVRNKNAAKRQE